MAGRYKQKEILFFRGLVKTLKSRVARELIRCVKQFETKKKPFFQRLTFDNSIHLITNLRIKERKVELLYFAYAKHCHLFPFDICAASQERSTRSRCYQWTIAQHIVCWMYTVLIPNICDHLM